jgi:hypothetical protein
MNTLSIHGTCQYCGHPLKVSIWKRKMRRREAYGILLIVAGFAVLSLNTLAGVIGVLLGIAMLVYGFFIPRVRQ